MQSMVSSETGREREVGLCRALDLGHLRLQAEGTVQTRASVFLGRQGETPCRRVDTALASTLKHCKLKCCTTQSLGAYETPKER